VTVSRYLPLMVAASSNTHVSTDGEENNICSANKCLSIFLSLPAFDDLRAFWTTPLAASEGDVLCFRLSVRILFL